MKKIILTITLAAASFGTAFAQDAQQAAAEATEAIAAAPQEEAPAPAPKYWTKSLLTNINFAQTKLTSWAAGGNDNVTLAGYVDANANYAKEKMTWNNRLQLDYGFLYSEDKPILQKNKDRIYLESKWGYDTPIKHLKYSASFDFKTQFDNNYAYGTPATTTDAVTGEVIEPTVQDWKDARTLKSGLFSPAYVTLGLGLDWTPTKWLSVNVAPLTGGIVVVNDELLRKSYGMELLKEGLDESDGANYKSSRFELGAQVKANADFVINDNMKYSTQLVLFSNYLKNPQNLRVNWDNKFFWKLAKYFALTFSTNLIYDDTVLITDDAHPNGWRTTQFKEFLELGFSYTISGK